MAPARAAFERAELVIFAYPVYSFLVPSQLHRFIELMKERGVSLKDKYVTQLSTSKHFFDVTAHRFMEENLHDLKDVAQEVREKIEIIPVSRISDLLSAVGVLKPVQV